MDMLEGVKISQMGAVSTLSGDESVPFARDGKNGRFAVRLLLNEIRSKVDADVYNSFVSRTEQALGGKVDAVVGMGLSQENFTSALKETLEDLASAGTAEAIAALETAVREITSLIESDSDGAINRFNEIVSFLAGVSDSDSLDGLLADISAQIVNVRKALEGKVAEVAVGLAAVETDLGNKVSKETGKGLSSNDFTTEEKTKLAELPEGSELSNVKSEDPMAGWELAEMPPYRRLWVEQWSALNGLTSDVAWYYDESTGLFGYRFKNVKADEQDVLAYQYDDITPQEAIVMLNAIQPSVVCYDMFRGVKRVNIPPLGYQTGSGPIINVLEKRIVVASSIEVLFLGWAGARMVKTSTGITIDQANSLRAIIGTLSTVDKSAPVYIASAAPHLEWLMLHAVSTNLYLQGAPRLSLASFRYMVARAANTTPITIMVHPDVYAKLTDVGNAEWYKVLTDASARNISFATV